MCERQEIVDSQDTHGLPLHMANDSANALLLSALFLKYCRMQAQVDQEVNVKIFETK
jgi:hypothetical protein